MPVSRCPRLTAVETEPVSVPSPLRPRRILSSPTPPDPEITSIENSSAPAPIASPTEQRPLRAREGPRGCSSADDFTYDLPPELVTLVRRNARVRVQSYAFVVGGRSTDSRRDEQKRRGGRCQHNGAHGDQASRSTYNQSFSKSLDESPNRLSERVEVVDGVRQRIPEDIGIPTSKTDRILTRPPSGLRVVVSGSEAYQAGLVVVQYSCEYKALE